MSKSTCLNGVVVVVVVVVGVVAFAVLDFESDDGGDIVGILNGLVGSVGSDGICSSFTS